ncbi:MAG: hypothetical protein KQH63_00610 [Desulfobulbaceae bacterium]|nr:hypothetical protein [Desulfobulbaceae bacterium]
MSGLNTILSGVYSSVSVSRGDAFGVSQPDRTQGPPSTVQEQDLFQSGQWWKNRATSGANEAGADSRSGSYSSQYAAKAYRDQGAGTAPLGSPESVPGEDGDDAAVNQEVEGGPETVSEENAETTTSMSSEAKGSDGEPLSRDELAQLTALKHADAAVRAHEQAHLTAAGGLAKGGASFSYKQGPDGRKYAVGGEVQIDTSKGATPEETLSKMMRVRAAALAPANPSPQDRKVAAAAASSMSKARQELNVQKTEGKESTGNAASDVTEGESDGAGNKKSAVSARAFAGYQAAPRSSRGFEISV